MSVRAIVWTFVGAMALVAAYCVTDEMTRHPEAKSSPAPDIRIPSHYYAYDDGQGHYGYTIPLSDIDRAAGIGSKPYAMYSFWRMENDGRVYLFGSANIRGQVIYRCDLPCTTVYAQSVTGGTSEYLPVNPDTILWEVVQDVTAGRLTAAKGALY